MYKKKLILFTNDEIARDSIRRDLEDFFEDFVEIEAYAMSDSIPAKSLEGDLILTISPLSFKKIQSYMKKETEILYGNRTITYESYDKLKALSKGTRALVINTNKYTTIDLAHFLMKINIPDVEFIPVYKELEMVPEADIAIYPLIFDNSIDIKNMRRLDLNIRKITPETYKVIMYSLNIESIYLENKLKKLSMELVSADLTDGTLSKVSELESILKNTLREIDDGVVVISDNDNRILYSNNSFFKMFEYNIEVILPEVLNEEIVPKEICLHLINGDDFENKLIYSKDINKHFAVSIRKIHLNRRKTGRIIIVKETSNIKMLGRKISNTLYKKGHIAKYRFEDIIGQSEILNNTIKKAKIIADVDKPSIIIGGSGTGKEMFAQSIHNFSQRRHEPFFAVNCAAFTAELLESELFGYVEGAFTGARKGGKSGLFEIAHQGTLFLDEIGDMPSGMQIRLLRVLQEGEVRRIGGEEIIPIDVRVIAATHKNLDELVEQGSFRLDLYHRLNIFTIYIPSLRERKNDIPLLIDYKLHDLAKNDGRSNIKKISNELMEILTNHAWQGNIRELMNCVEYMYYMGGEVLEIDDLPSNFRIVSDTSKNNEVNNLLSSFTNNEKQIISEILKIISSRNVGRRKILNILEEREFAISEYKLRGLLSLMKEHSIIEYLGNGKSATISSKGKILLQNI